MRRLILCAAAVLCGGGQVEGAVQYMITDLGTLGGDWSTASAINNLGQVAGTTSLVADGAGQSAFLWDAGTMRDLSPPGVTDSAWGINDLGQVVGTEYNFQEAVLFSNGERIHLGTLGGSESLAYDINNSGQVVGSARNLAGEERPSLFSNGTVQDLGSFGGGHGVARAINESGQVVGLSRFAKGSNRAFLYSDGVMHDLGTLTGDKSSAMDINSSGDVVGWFSTGQNSSRVFLYSDGVMHDLGAFDGRSSVATAINDSGQILGRYRDAGSPSDYRPFLYDDGVITDLNDFLPFDSPWVLRYANDINNSGQIVGLGEIDGQNRAFLLTPVPEPSTLIIWSLLGALGIGVGWWRRRRSV